MKAFWGILLSAILVACAPSSVVIPQTETATIIPINTSIVSSAPIATIIPSTAIFSTESLSTPAPIIPKVKIISPETREVELSVLELSDSTRLILYYPSSDSLRIMAKQDIRPQRIPNINPKDILNYGVRVSPDKEWFIYNVFKELKDGVAYYDLWISSIDGKNQNIAISNVRGATEARWVTNEQLELWYHPDGARACPERELVVNPFTHETFTPPKIPPSSEPHCFFPLSTSPDHTKIIYRSKDSELWNIYDLNSGKNQNIFPWLSPSDSFTLWPKYIKWLPSGITYVVPNEESIDFTLDLSPSSALDNMGEWNTISLPSSSKILWNMFPWVSLENGLIGFDMIDSQTDPLDASEDSPASKFVIFDLRTSTLYDYNLDRARTRDLQRVSSYFVEASADNRFLAWTIYRPPGMGNAIETVVLDRITGQIARIKGFEFFGWGEVTQP